MSETEKNAQTSPPLEEPSGAHLLTPVASATAGRRHLVGRPIGEICAELYQLSATHIGEALDVQAQKGGPRLGEILVDKKHLSDREVLAALAVQLDLPFLAELHPDAIPDELVRAVPIGFAKQNCVVTLGRTDDGIILVACADPLDTATLDDLRILLKAELELAVAPPDLIVLAINSAYDRATAKAEHAVADLEEGPATEIGE
ncbi:MAG: type II secretion system protein GspE, partial [Deltaproteobacteria bacterium]|nr:type II secretion system protein GspE [Deltaproteobacteria bacterium]